MDGHSIGRAEIEAADRAYPPLRAPNAGARARARRLRPRLRITLKLELVQHTGSFKPRGAFNKILSSDVPADGVIAASGGNFGLAVAYAAPEVIGPRSSCPRRRRR